MKRKYAKFSAIKGETQQHSIPTWIRRLHLCYIAVSTRIRILLTQWPTVAKSKEIQRVSASQINDSDPPTQERGKACFAGAVPECWIYSCA